MPWRRGIRGRLATVIVALVALTAGVLGVGAAVVADIRLHGQAVEDAADAARFDLSVTVPQRLLPPEPTREDLDRSGLADTFRLRGIETVVDLGDQGVFTSRADLAGLLDRLPADVRSRVDGGELAYAWTDGPIGAVLVVAGRPADTAGGTTSGPPFYFVHDVAAMQAAIDQLRVALLAGAVILVLFAFAVARRLAQEVLAPVQEASLAAERIAAGDLDARIGLSGADELGAMAASFDRMADSVQASQEQQRRFVADVAHELRTPLTALVAEASVVAAHLDELPPDRRRPVELLIADVGRLRTLVEELMELSRFDAGVEHADRVDVDIRRLVRAIVATRLPTALVEIEVEVPPTIPSDPRRLERIVGNLLDNAREHAAGDAVRVGVARADVEGAPGLTITVADRGPGVPADRLDRIFERFSKLDASRRGGSSGLGLAIAAEHAEILGGFLEARPRAGGGLAVTLALPLGPVTGSLPVGDGTVISRREAEDLATSPQETQP
jgi:signal transduction histidine kinase